MVKEKMNSMEVMDRIQLAGGVSLRVSNSGLKCWAHISIAKASRTPVFTLLPDRSPSMAQGHQINLSQTLLSSAVQGPAYQAKFKSQPAWLLKFSC